MWLFWKENEMRSQLMYIAIDKIVALANEKCCSHVPITID
jgi:hypothetical protein